MVSVTVKLDPATSRVVSRELPDVKNVIHLSTHEKEDTTENNEASSGGEAGVAPNIGQSLTTGGGAGGTTNNTDSTESEYKTDYATRESVVQHPAGEVTALAASVRVPRSYFVQAYKNANGGKEANDAALAAYTTTELDEIRKNVKGCTGITADDAIIVGEYSDATPVEPVNTALPASSPVASMVTSHGKEIGVGFLAAMSLFMVSMMVRKSTPAPVLAAPVEKPDAGKLPGGEEVAGEVAEGGAMLDGMELDEDAVKTQQMLDQVQHLVAESPDAAANLVKRWLNRT
jgi:flagellar biosynthesis/type III secretory pathway M-ring protein FliF/YscJ